MKVAVFVLVSVFFSLAHAQGINSHGFRFSDTLETVGTEDALGISSELVQNKQPFLLRTSFDYARDSLSAEDSSSSKSASFVDHLYSVSLGASAIINSKILVGFTAPIHFVQLSENYVSGQFDSNAWKFGDMLVHAKLRFTPDHAKINVALGAALALPTGNKTYFVSNDSFGFGPRILADTTLGRWKWMMHAGYSRAPNAQFLSIDHRHLIDAGVGLFYRINQKFGWNAEWLQSISIPNIENGQNPTLVNLGLRYDAVTAKIFVGGGLQGFDFTDGHRPLILYAGVKYPFGAKRIATPAPPEPADTVETTPPSPEPIDTQLSPAAENIRAMVVYFDNNLSNVKSEYFEMLNQVASLLNQNSAKIQFLIIHGHTDPRGDASYNKSLSERRAQAVKNYLVQLGVNEYSILFDGYGETLIKALEEREYRNNRRVEFELITK